MYRCFPLAFCGMLLMTGCASKGGEMRVVVPQKKTYLHAEAVDGGVVDLPPQVLEEVRPSAPEELVSDGAAPSVVLRFVVDAKGRIGEVAIAETSDDRLEALAIEAVSGWKLRPALRDGRAIPVVATVQLTFDVARSSGKPAPDRESGPAAG